MGKKKKTPHTPVWLNVHEVGGSKNTQWEEIDKQAEKKRGGIDQAEINTVKEFGVDRAGGKWCMYELLSVGTGDATTMFLGHNYLKIWYSSRSMWTLVRFIGKIHVVGIPFCNSLEDFLLRKLTKSTSINKRRIKILLFFQQWVQAKTHTRLRKCRLISLACSDNALPLQPKVPYLRFIWKAINQPHKSWSSLLARNSCERQNLSSLQLKASELCAQGSPEAAQNNSCVIRNPGHKRWQILKRLQN